MSFRRHILPVLILGVIAHGSPAHALADEATAVTADSTAPTETQADASLFHGWLQTSVDATVASKYLFQGLDYSDGRSVIEPNIVMSHGPYSAVIWANYQPNLGDVNEVDLSIKATRSFGLFTVSPGYTALRYPNRDWDPSQELFADMALTAPLNPTLSVHYDVDAGDGAYLTLGLSREIAPTLSFATNVFYQRHYYGMTGFPAAEFRVSTALPFGGFLMAPSLSRFVTFDNSDFRGAANPRPGWSLSVNLTAKP